MRAIVSGAAGFVGSHLVDRLLAEGYEVIGIDNFVTGRACNIMHLASDGRFSLRVEDVKDVTSIDGQIDWVMHLASPASPPKYQAEPIMTLRTNAEGTYNLLELARESNAIFLLASTSEVYGDPAVHPQNEAYWGNVNPVGPRSMYDEGKRYAEAMCASHSRHYGTRIRIARIFNTYGPRMAPDDGRVISNMICQALRGEPLTIYGDGSYTRSFQYIDDLIEGLIRLMMSEIQRPVNIGNPEEYSIQEIAEKIRNAVECNVPISYLPSLEDDPTRRCPDITLARESLDWQPETSLAEGLSRTVGYFRASLGL